MATANDVLAYWFGDPTAPPPPDQMKRWFYGGAEVDADIRERFGATLELAIQGTLDSWADTPRGRLALIILFDQFSRNAFRDTSRAYAQDERALSLSNEGYERGEDKDFSVYECLFFNMPFVHAENIAMQDIALARCEAFSSRAKTEGEKKMCESAISEAKRHRDLIVRFGRFPARNEALGRASTAEERVFLAEQTKR